MGEIEDLEAVKLGKIISQMHDLSYLELNLP
jgi:hypothetical protein